MSGLTSRRTARGMVTAELAVAILAAFSLFLLLCWGLVLVGVQLRFLPSSQWLNTLRGRVLRSLPQRSIFRPDHISKKTGPSRCGNSSLTGPPASVT